MTVCNFSFKVSDTLIHIYRQAKMHINLKKKKRKGEELFLSNFIWAGELRVENWGIWQYSLGNLCKVPRIQGHLTIWCSLTKDLPLGWDTYFLIHWSFRAGPSSPGVHLDNHRALGMTQPGCSCCLMYHPLVRDQYVGLRPPESWWDILRTAVWLIRLLPTQSSLCSLHNLQPREHAAPPFPVCSLLFSTGVPLLHTKPQV